MKLFTFNIKTSNRIYLLFHPLLLALYSFLIILYFTPDYFKKYNAEIIDTEYRADFNKTYYHDLNGDGISEKVSTGYNRGDKEIYIQHYNLNNKVYDQWMPRGKWLIRYKPIFGDYNNNGFAEIYCLSIDGDSIFLSIKELMLEGGLEIKNRFVCKTGTFENGKIDVADCSSKLMDIDSDGLAEYVFIIYGGFSKFPRNAFAYNISKDTLIMSPLSASGINQNFQFMDINGDGVDEITGHVSSPENINYEMPYTDSSAWLMVLNPKTMDFHFPPVRFNVGIGSWIKPAFYNVNSRKYIAASVYSNSAKLGIDYLQLKLFDKYGKLLKEKNVEQSQIKSIKFLNPKNKKDDNFYLIDNYGNIYKTDTSLMLYPYLEHGFKNINVSHSYSLIDADGDGENEVLFFGGNKKAKTYLLIYRQNLKEAMAITLPESKSLRDPHFSIINDGNRESLILMLQAGNYVYKIKYRKNPYFLLKYPAYISVYLLLFLSFWLLQRIQNKYAQRKYEAEKQLVKQQLTISKNQLEPHFMLNTLNNIGYMFAKEDKDKAQFYFGKFASLIHRGLKYADQVETSLYEELQFIRDYLILQKRRFNDELNFHIEADEEISLNTIKIPHSLIFTFVENAIKHGLQLKPNDRQLKLFVKRNSGKIIITITDNGVGRKQSKILKTTGTGKGLGIVANIVEGYNKLYNRSISYEMKDLVGENEVGEGTEVRVEV